LKENTSFSKEEIKQWHKGFHKDCPSGHLTQDKFKEVYSQFFPGGDPDAFCDHVFRSFDKDGSGTVEFKEFLMAVNITSARGDPKEKLNWAFSMYDIDKNGNVTIDEMESIINAIYSMMGSAVVDVTEETAQEKTRKIFEKMDINNDGVLSKKEFVQGCMNDIKVYQMLVGDAGDKADAGEFTQL